MIRLPGISNGLNARQSEIFILRSLKEPLGGSCVKVFDCRAFSYCLSKKMKYLAVLNCAQGNDDTLCQKVTLHQDQ